MTFSSDSYVISSNCISGEIMRCGTLSNADGLPGGMLDWIRETFSTKKSLKLFTKVATSAEGREWRIQRQLKRKQCGKAVHCCLHIQHTLFVVAFLSMSNKQIHLLFGCNIHFTVHSQTTIGSNTVLNGSQ